MTDGVGPKVERFFCIAEMASTLASRCACSLQTTSCARSCPVRSIGAAFSSSRPSINGSLRRSAERQSDSIVLLPSRGRLGPIAAFDGGNKDGSKTAVQFNPVYAAIFGGYAALMLLQNPYIFAALTILTIMPQNSATTSLNSLVLLFYDSGVFMNFAGEPCGIHAPMQHATLSEPIHYLLFHASPAAITCVSSCLQRRSTLCGSFPGSPLHAH